MIVPTLTFDNIIYATVVGKEFKLMSLRKNKSNCISISLINMSINALCFYNNKARGVQWNIFPLGDF